MDEYKNSFHRILELDRELDSIKDLEMMLERLLFMARREASADAGTVYLAQGDSLLFSHTQNDTFQARLKHTEKLVYTQFTIPINDESISGFVALNQESLNIPDMYAIDPDASYNFDPSFDQRTGYKTISSLTIPLISSENELLGVMQLINAKNEKNKVVPFNQENIPFFELFARFASKAIQRGQMTRDLLQTIIRFAGMRDPSETGPHVNRVAALATEIYEAWAKLNYIEADVIDKNKDMLRMAAMLHDVGKVGISDLLLKKPGKFSDSEYRIMQSHTWLGARQFVENSELNIMAKEVALYHHENWDGSGYPGKIGDLFEADKYIHESEKRPPGLLGEEIPLFARIVAISDVYDALCSRRVYKNFWEEDLVLETIRKQSGQKFDPNLVSIFFSILPTLRNVRQRYPDPE